MCIPTTLNPPGSFNVSVYSSGRNWFQCDGIVKLGQAETCSYLFDKIFRLLVYYHIQKVGVLYLIGGMQYIWGGTELSIKGIKGQCFGGQ